MKIRGLFLLAIFCLASSVFADNRHIHPSVKANSDTASAKKAMMPDYCEIEIINNSYDHVTIFGTFEDGATLIPFDIYRYEYPHYISLYYPDFDGVYRCHSTMFLHIETFDHYTLFSNYVRVGSTIRLLPFVGKTSKAEVQAKPEVQS